MENNALTDHAYDGIQEYDNPLPGWWKWTFVASIVFSIAYAMYFHVGAPGRSILDGYEAEQTAMSMKLFASIGELQPDEPTLLISAHDTTRLRIGESIFRSNCISCHGRYGEGKVGPNLTDEYYKNVRTVTDLIKILNNGAGNGAMPAWSNRLEPNEIILVAAYVASLRGTQPAAEGKGPDGSEIAPWPDPPAEQAKTEEEK